MYLKEPNIVQTIFCTLTPAFYRIFFFFLGIPEGILLNGVSQNKGKSILPDNNTDKLSTFHFVLSHFYCCWQSRKYKRASFIFPYHNTCGIISHFNIPGNFKFKFLEKKKQIIIIIPQTPKIFEVQLWKQTDNFHVKLFLVVYKWFLLYFQFLHKPSEISIVNKLQRNQILKIHFGFIVYCYTHLPLP